MNGDESGGQCGLLTMPQVDAGRVWGALVSLERWFSITCTVRTKPLAPLIPARCYHDVFTPTRGSVSIHVFSERTRRSVGVIRIGILHAHKRIHRSKRRNATIASKPDFHNL